MVSDRDLHHIHCTQTHSSLRQRNFSHLAIQCLPLGGLIVPLWPYMLSPPPLIKFTTYASQFWIIVMLFLCEIHSISSFFYPIHSSNSLWNLLILIQCDISLMLLFLFCVCDFYFAHKLLKLYIFPSD